MRLYLGESVDNPVKRKKYSKTTLYTNKRNHMHRYQIVYQKTKQNKTEQPKNKTNNNMKKIIV